MALRSGKRLGGTQPRRVGRLLQRSREPLREGHPYGVLLMFALGLFVVGGVAGFGWSADREVRGGVLRQRAAAERRPDWVYLENLPRYVPEAFVTVVQPSLLTRGRVQSDDGGRTMAGELVRQVHLLPNSLAGEAHGLAMAPALEKRISSHDLIELYLNRVYLGRVGGYPVFGVYHAARDYFDKEPTELTLSEAATLAGLLLSPQIYDPKAEVGAVGARRNEVLEVMLRGELITPAEYAQAIAEPLGIQPGLDQIPFSRPSSWGQPSPVLRLPPNLRPVPDDSTKAEPQP